jgi:hypothetical protein
MSCYYYDLFKRIIEDCIDIPTLDLIKDYYRNNDSEVCPYVPSPSALVALDELLEERRQILMGNGDKPLELIN